MRRAFGWGVVACATALIVAGLALGMLAASVEEATQRDEPRRPGWFPRGRGNA